MVPQKLECLSPLMQVIGVATKFGACQISGRQMRFCLIVPSQPPRPPAAPHHRLSGESQAELGLPRGGREAHQGGQKHLTGWLRGAWQDEVWRRKEAVRNSK